MILDKIELLKLTKKLIGDYDCDITSLIDSAEILNAWLEKSSKVGEEHFSIEYCCGG